MPMNPRDVQGEPFVLIAILGIVQTPANPRDALLHVTGGNEQFVTSTDQIEATLRVDDEPRHDAGELLTELSRQPQPPARGVRPECVAPSRSHVG